MRYVRFAALLLVAAMVAVARWVAFTDKRGDVIAQTNRKTAQSAVETAKEIDRHAKIIDVPDDDLDRQLRDLRAKTAKAGKSK